MNRCDAEFVRWHWWVAGQAFPKDVRVPQGVKVALLPSPLEDLDVILGKQVILRPRLTNNKNDNAGDVADPESKVRMMLPPPPLGINAAQSASLSSTSSNNVDGVGVDSPSQSQPIVYYYDLQTRLHDDFAGLAVLLLLLQVSLFIIGVAKRG